MINAVKQLLGINTAKDGLTQCQREAYVDLFLFCMHADTRLEMNKQQWIEKEIDKLDWTSGILIETYINNATARVRAAARDEAERERLLADISERLGTDHCRRHALELSTRMLTSTGASSDKAFVGEIKKAFGIDEDPA